MKLKLKIHPLYSYYVLTSSLSSIKYFSNFVFWLKVMLRIMQNIESNISMLNFFFFFFEKVDLMFERLAIQRNQRMPPISKDFSFIVLQITVVLSVLSDREKQEKQERMKGWERQIATSQRKTPICLSTIRRLTFY